MIVLLVSGVAIVAFLLGFWVFRIQAAASRVIDIAWSARSAMLDPDMDDIDKEKLIQKFSFFFFRGFVSILARSTGAILLSIVPVWLADLTNLASKEDIYVFLLRWDVIAGSSVLIGLGWILLERMRRSW